MLCNLQGWYTSCFLKSSFLFWYFIFEGTWPVAFCKAHVHWILLWKGHQGQDQGNRARTWATESRNRPTEAPRPGTGQPRPGTGQPRPGTGQPSPGTGQLGPRPGQLRPRPGQLKSCPVCDSSPTESSTVLRSNIVFLYLFFLL